MKPNAPLKSETQPFIEYNIGPGTLAIGCSEQWKPSLDGPSTALEVEDFDAAVVRAKELKADVVKDRYWSENANWEFWLRDPNGYTIVLSSPLP